MISLLSFLPPESEEIETEELFDEEIVIVIAAESPLAAKLETGDLSCLPLVLPGRWGASAIRRLVDQRLASEKIQAKVFAEMNDIHALRKVAESGRAATILVSYCTGKS